jgi:hypothetical protein
MRTSKSTCTKPEKIESTFNRPRIPTEDIKNTLIDIEQKSYCRMMKYQKDTHRHQIEENSPMVGKCIAPPVYHFYNQRNKGENIRRLG